MKKIFYSILAVLLFWTASNSLGMERTTKLFKKIKITRQDQGNQKLLKIKKQVNKALDNLENHYEKIKQTKDNIEVLGQKLRNQKTNKKRNKTVQELNKQNQILQTLKNNLWQKLENTILELKILQNQAQSVSMQLVRLIKQNINTLEEILYPEETNNNCNVKRKLDFGNEPISRKKQKTSENESSSSSDNMETTPIIDLTYNDEINTPDDNGSPFSNTNLGTYIENDEIPTNPTDLQDDSSSSDSDLLEYFFGQPEEEDPDETIFLPYMAPQQGNQPINPHLQNQLNQLLGSFNFFGTETGFFS